MQLNEKLQNCCKLPGEGDFVGNLIQYCWYCTVPTYMRHPVYYNLSFQSHIILWSSKDHLYFGTTNRNMLTIKYRCSLWKELPRIPQKLEIKSFTRRMKSHWKLSANANWKFVQQIEMWLLACCKNFYLFEESGKRPWVLQYFIQRFK